MAQALTYKKAGVDIAKANKFVDAIKQMSGVTMNRGVINRPGSFGALFDLKSFKCKNPVLVSSTDGVGTKFPAQSKSDKPIRRPIQDAFLHPLLFPVHPNISLSASPWQSWESIHINWVGICIEAVAHKSVR